MNQYSLSVNYKKRFIVFLAAFALLLGGIIYVLCRVSEPVFFSWLRIVGLGKWLESARQSFHFEGLILPDWIIYSLPNGLWAFAYTMVISSIWYNNKSRIKYFWYMSVPILVIGFELLQYPGILPGTFCVTDLILGAIGILIGFIFIRSKTYNYEKAIRQ